MAKSVSREDGVVRRKSFAKAFKLEAVRLLELGQRPVTQLAMELGVERKQLYKWQKQLRELHVEHHEAYGAVKTWRALNATGVACGRHRVARLRREGGIETRRQRRFGRPTDTGSPVRPAV